MPDYHAWNEALIAFFVDATPLGAPVYLAVSDDALTQVGRELLGLDGPASDPMSDFLTAVRGRVVAAGRIELRGMTATDAAGRPLCVGFLCALVLAAARMREADAMDDVNYFGRLRAVLDLPEGRGRPWGMTSGAEAEEPLWRLWNFWLQVQGRLPSATPGDEGPQRYIHYARSQALLRDADHDKLVELFGAKGWRDDVDAEILLLRIRREAPYLTAHLRELLGADSGRLQAVAEAMHDLYETWRIDPTATGRAAPRGRLVYAGLYRVHDPIRDTVEYYLYPRAAPPGIRVQLPDGGRDLSPERPGWSLPLRPFEAAELYDGARYPIVQPAAAEALVLLRRDFWLLVADRENPDSGIYASWGPPRLGEPFVLLCRRELEPQVRELQQENLIAVSEPAAAFGDDWLEFRDCLVVSEAWSGSYFGASDLYESLRPADRCNVTASGGLRLPERGGWLDGFGPAITVFGFDAEAHLAVVEVRTERVVLERTQPAGEPVPLAWPGPGAYRVTATCGGQESRRPVLITSWDDVRRAGEVQREALTLGGVHVCGAALL